MDFFGIIGETFARSGFANLSWQQGVMLLISFVLLYCAIVNGFERPFRTLARRLRKPSPNWQAFIGMIPACSRSFTAVLSPPSSPASSSWA